MRKKIFVALAVLAIAFAFSGCNGKQEAESTRFEIVERSSFTKVIRDKETGVLYLLARNDGGSGSGLTVLVNPDGTPITIPAE